MVNAWTQLRINKDRLIRRIEDLAKIGGLEGGGVCRLALTQEDKLGRDQVVTWMKELGLSVTVDKIGNVVGTRPGELSGPAVMTGSHIDTVRTGGPYDGNLGVLAGLEVAQVLNDAGVKTKHPFSVAFFTNEEGSRFAPDMMGSLVHQGVLDLDEALLTKGIDGTTVQENLKNIGYDGAEEVGQCRAHAFVELHVEQGPVLEIEDVTIGAVDGVQGISWTELTIGGVSNHAGTTPMSMRTDAGYAAAAITCFVRKLAEEIGHPQVATVGMVKLSPNLVNVVPNKAVMTVDLRHTCEDTLLSAEKRFFEFLEELKEKEGVSIEHRSLARFEPVVFAEEMIQRVEAQAKTLGYSVKRMPSGAGHDAQIFAPSCPTSMIFVPSVKGISHNIEEFTEASDIEAGGNVLLQVLLDKLMNE
ncbi:MAG: Zn-dependent hydrolase [Planctomycetota bacterium]|nr:Zn-dependent hydrolase [Planctomycetota bacterium]